MSYYIYIVRCEGGTHYTGITTDPHRRMREHVLHRKAGAKYTKSHNVLSLEALWSAETRSEASILEYALKQLPREKKLRLIKDPTLLPELLPPHINAAAYQAEETFSLDDLRPAQGHAGIEPCDASE